jgi:hypothetical protein
MLACQSLLPLTNHLYPSIIERSINYLEPLTMPTTKEGQESVVKHFLDSGSTYIVQLFLITLAAQTYTRVPLPYSILQLGLVVAAALTWKWWRPERPLHEAVKSDDTSTVRKALSQNPRPNIRNISGETALHCACKFSSVEMISFLISQGADVNALKRNCESPLHWAVASGHCDKVSLLITQGAEIEIKDNLGKTPLFWAVCRNFLTITELLLNNGADYNTQSDEGDSLIEVAREKGFTGIIQLLNEFSTRNSD